jgi:hypothetical protein
MQTTAVTWNQHVDAHTFIVMEMKRWTSSYRNIHFKIHIQLTDHKTIGKQFLDIRYDMGDYWRWNVCFI